MRSGADPKYGCYYAKMAQGGVGVGSQSPEVYKAEQEQGNRIRKQPIQDVESRVLRKD